MRTLYRRLLSDEARHWLYKLRHPAEFRELRRVVHPSPKGDFSLRKFDQHQCIFVHITKSAGTSVAKALFGELPYHYTATQYRVIFGRRDFSRYFKFAFVRNPWDRLYSAYSYLKGGGWDAKDKAWAEQHLTGIDDFNQFVTEWLTPARLDSHMHFWPQSRFICDRRGRPLIDYLGYFETIADDFDQIRRRLHIETTLPHTNASERIGYRSAYSPEAVEAVARLYPEDIARFGYHFDGFQRMRISNGKFIAARSPA